MSAVELSVNARMKEIYRRRDEGRRLSQERARRGWTPFPTLAEVEGKEIRFEDVPGHLTREEALAGRDGK